ncbi:MAG: exopolysaccharide biosynthesis protein [Bdellovibrionaceae bacterium]|nr:exopolysaccharide biosynthesis protein [Bdellovibrio sp.]
MSKTESKPISQPVEFSLKQAMQTLEHKAQPDGLHVEGLIATFGSRSHGLLVLFFSIPFLQPIPLLGLSTPLGIMIAVVGTLLAFDQKPWLPKKLMRKHLKPNLITSLCKYLIKFLDKTEHLIKPRFGAFSKHPCTRVMNGLLMAIYGLLLALPLPIPFSNSVPAYFLVLNALGWLEKDGGLLILSYAIALGGFIFFAGLGVGSVEFFNWLNLSRFF